MGATIQVMLKRMGLVSAFIAAAGQPLGAGLPPSSDETLSFAQAIAQSDALPAVGVSRLQRRLVLLEGGLTFGVAPCATALRWDSERGVTVGCLQFGLLGRLQPILTALEQNHPARIDEAFDTQATDVRAMLRLSSVAEQAAWGRSLADGEGRLREPWATGFARLVTMPEFQSAYLEATTARFRLATDWARQFGLRSTRGVAIMFDLALYRGIPADQVGPLAHVADAAIVGLVGRGAELSRLAAVAKARSELDPADALLRFHLESIATGTAKFGTLRIDLGAFDVSAEPTDDVQN